MNERKIFVSEGNSVGEHSNWLPGNHNSAPEAAERGFREFDGNFTLWELDPEGNPVSIDVDVDGDGNFFEVFEG